MSVQSSITRRSIGCCFKRELVLLFVLVSMSVVVAAMSRNRGTVAAAAFTRNTLAFAAGSNGHRHRFRYQPSQTKACFGGFQTIQTLLPNSLLPLAFLREPLQQQCKVVTKQPARALLTACFSTQRNDATATMDIEDESTLPKTSAVSLSPPQQYTLATITYLELSDLLVHTLKYPKFRVDQVWHWIREKGVLTVNDMTNIPSKLKDDLSQYCVPSTLRLVAQQVSAADGTIKRAYQIAPTTTASSTSSTTSLQKPILIESVLMGPYNDGHYTACISSQAGCAQGCVFCATGQMGLVRQLTANEIFEQVVQFATLLQRENDRDDRNDNDTTTPQSQLKRKPKRLSNIVFMGMGEPLANYQAVRTAVNRITTELNISARKITISTVGIVPKIRQLMVDPNMPPVRLAVSLHCADNAERTALLPANRRNGGLDTLMTTLKEYIDTTGRRLTLEWALIAGENDSIHTARTLGRLIVQKHDLRPDMVHINVIPLNPTSLYAGHASRKSAVNAFCQTLQTEFGISCTPRVRRGIDIDAGCGQLTTALLSLPENGGSATTTHEPESTGKSDELAVLQKTDETSTASMPPLSPPPVSRPVEPLTRQSASSTSSNRRSVTAITAAAATAAVPAIVNDNVGEISYDFDDDDFDNPELESRFEQQEANRLVNLIQGTTINLSALPSLSSEPKPLTAPMATRNNAVPTNRVAVPTRTKTPTTGTGTARRPKEATSTSSPLRRQSSPKAKSNSSRTGNIA